MKEHVKEEQERDSKRSCTTMPFTDNYTVDKVSIAVIAE